jgi:hypothetical protein
MDDAKNAPPPPPGGDPGEPGAMKATEPRSPARHVSVQFGPTQSIPGSRLKPPGKLRPGS